MKKYLFLLISVAISCYSIAQEAGSFTDTRDGKTYKTKKIGKQVWMAENLNYETSNGSWCYDDTPANCKKFGRLYDWETAKSVCPAGWRLPSKSDFETLLSNVGSSGSNAYHALIDGGSSGFSALFGGWRNHNGYSFDIGNYAYWWSSSESSTFNAWNLFMSSYRQNAYLYYYSTAWGFSVRCLQN